MSRTVTAHLFHSVNGVSEHPDRWQFDAFGPEEGEMMGTMIGSATDVIIGRVLWTEWSQYWPSAGDTDPFGQFINPVRKHVLSTTLSGDLPWNSTLVTGDPLEYVRALRESGDGTISVVGGLDATRFLFLAGLVDELTLTTHPVITNEGRRLFDETIPTSRLTLLRSTATSAGNVISTYALADPDSSR